MKLDRSSSPRYAAPRRRASDYEILKRRAEDQERSAWTIVLCFGVMALAALLRAVAL